MFMTNWSKDLPSCSEKDSSGKSVHKTDPACTWDLSSLYPAMEAWEDGKIRIAKEMEEIQRFQGTLGRSASMLFECLEMNSRISQVLERLFNYASLLLDQDIRDAGHLAMKDEISQLITRYRSMTAYIEPELLRIREEKLKSFMEQESRLSPYRFFLQDLLRRKEHTLSEKEEIIIAEASRISRAPYSIYSIFSHAELPYPRITLSSGERVTLDPAGYSRYRSVPEREDRERVFQSFWKAIYRFRRTFGAKLNANIQKDFFYTTVRKYPSSLAASLDSNNIPLSVYHGLIRQVREALPTFHRYLMLKKRLLGVEQLRYSDLYASAVPKLNLNYSWEQARDLVLDAVTPLGEPYVERARKAFGERWIDVYPARGKRSGAYCNDGAYRVHPYILLNFNSQYEDVSTLSHELGHAMHTLLAQEKQPYPTADYPIFLAEVASTLNEALLMEAVLEEETDPQVQLTLLMEYLDGVKGTIFRQTHFAEFELQIHDQVEKGKALTGDLLTEMYGESLRAYYGHGRGVCKIDDLYTVEWAYISHFYYNFYVYQYATSFTASSALAQKILAGDTGARAKYLELLQAGGSDYPIPLLKNAGVDLTTEEPMNSVVEKMNQVMDRVEAILWK
jgi:oligoendopeptidase F